MNQNCVNLHFLFVPSIAFVGKIYYVVCDYLDCQAKDDEMEGMQYAWQKRSA